MLVRNRAPHTHVGTADYASFQFASKSTLFGAVYARTREDVFSRSLERFGRICCCANVCACHHASTPILVQIRLHGHGVQG